MNNQINKIFDSVKAEEELKKHTREFLYDRLYRKRKGISPYIKFAIVCSLFVLLGIGGYGVYQIPAACISIDVNPSIELEVNRFDRVISVIPYNEDGKEAVKHLKLKHLKYEEAVTTLLASDAMASYVNETDQINILVVCSDKKKSQQMQEQVISCTGNRYGYVNCHVGKEADVKKAHHAGLSVGKYQILLELQKLGLEITVEDVKKMSMRELRELLNQYSDGSPDVSGEEEMMQGHYHHGNGNH